MSINPQIYNDGVNGLLSYDEIESLPRDYEMYKSMFHHAADTRRNN